MLDYDTIKAKYEYPELYTIYVHNYEGTPTIMRFRDATSVIHATQLMENKGHLCLIIPPK